MRRGEIDTCYCWSLFAIKIFIFPNGNKGNKISVYFSLTTEAEQFTYLLVTRDSFAAFRYEICLLSVKL